MVGEKKRRHETCRRIEVVGGREWWRLGRYKLARRTLRFSDRWYIDIFYSGKGGLFGIVDCIWRRAAVPAVGFSHTGCQVVFFDPNFKLFSLGTDVVGPEEGDTKEHAGNTKGQDGSVEALLPLRMLSADPTSKEGTNPRSKTAHGHQGSSVSRKESWRVRCAGGEQTGE